MRTLLSALVLGAFAAALPAQQMGSVNASAPTVTQSIKFANGASLSIEYKSITWAQGRTMDALKDAERGARMRERVNAQAERAPLGSAAVASAVTIGDQTVKAGDYKLYFTIDDENAWHLVLAAEEGDAKHTWKLDLKDTEKAQSRLVVGLMAGAKDTEATMKIAFGSSACTVACSAEAPAKPAKN
jgi:hypothetical protein